MMIVEFRDLGKMDYQQTWDLQESLLKKNVLIKQQANVPVSGNNSEISVGDSTTHYLFFVEHPPVYTLGKSGNIHNVLLTKEEMGEKGIQFFHTNRGGDITFHGDQQIVGYPILDLERFKTDIGWYLRNLEEVIILALSNYSIIAGRSPGETGVWIDPGIPGKERKICAMGVRTSRWITMHGFALNVNTDLTYFNHIIPCGIQNKQVTSIERELGRRIDFDEAKSFVKSAFAEVFGVELVES